MNELVGSSGKQPEHILPSLQLDTGIVLHQRTEDDLGKKLSYSYLSRLHIFQALEITKVWINRGKGPTEFDDGSRDYFTVAQAMAAIGIPPVKPLEELTALKQRTQSEANKYVNDKVAGNIIKTEALLGTWRTPQEITDNIQQEGEVVMDCLLYLAQLREVTNPSSREYLDSAINFLPSVRTIFWTRMKYHARLGQLLTQAGLDGTEQFSKAEELALLEPADTVNRPGRYASLARAYIAAGLLDEALHLLTINQRGDNVTSPEAIARKRTRDALVKVFVPIHIKQGRLDDAENLVATQMVHGKNNRYLAKVLEARAIAQARGGGDPTDVLNELEDRLQRVKPDALYMHVPVRLSMARALLLSEDNTNALNQISLLWKHMQEQLAHDGYGSYAKFAFRDFIRGISNLGYDATPITRVAASFPASQYRYKESVVEDVIEAGYVDVANELMLKHKTYDKWACNIPTLLVHLARAEGKQQLSNDQISSLNGADIASIVESNNSIAQQAAGYFGLDQALDKKDVTAGARFALNFGKSVALDLNNQIEVEEDAYLENKRYVAFKVMGKSGLPWRSALYSQVDHELAYAFARLNEDTVYRLLEHEILPTGDIVFYLQESGTQSVDELLQLKEETKLGRFNPRNLLQRDLEYMRYLRFALEVAPELANLEHFRTIGFVDEDRQLSGFEQMQAEACAFEAANGFWYINSLVESGKIVDLVANERNGANLFGEPLRPYLEDIGVNLSRYHIHGNSDKLAKDLLPGFEKYLKDRNPNAIVVVDTTPNSFSDVPRLPSALNVYRRWFMALGRKDPTQKREIAFWVPDPHKNIIIGEKTVTYREADTASSDQYVIFMNPVIVNSNLFHGIVETTAEYKPGYFDDPNLKAGELAFGFTSYGIQLLSEGRTEEGLIRSVQKHIEYALPRMLRHTHPYTGYKGEITS